MSETDVAVATTRSRHTYAVLGCLIVWSLAAAGCGGGADLEPGSIATAPAQTGDGSQSVVDLDSDGSQSVVDLDSDGSQSVVDLDSDGSQSVVDLDSDGSQSVVDLDSDGDPGSEETGDSPQQDQDEVEYVYDDDRAEDFFHDADGRRFFEQGMYDDPDFRAEFRRTYRPVESAQAFSDFSLAYPHLSGRVRFVAFGSLDGDGRAALPIAGATIVARRSTLGLPSHLKGPQALKLWYANEPSYRSSYQDLAGVSAGSVCSTYDFLAEMFRRYCNRMLTWAVKDDVEAYEYALSTESFNFGIPVGEQVQSSLESILTIPDVTVATTGIDGAVEMWLSPASEYEICVLSPEVPGLIAGCEYDFSPMTTGNSSSPGLLPLGPRVVMAYFSFGRAYIGTHKDFEGWRKDRFYYWFQRIAEGLFGADWQAEFLINRWSETLTLLSDDWSIIVPDTALENTGQALATIDVLKAEESDPGGELAFVRDADIGAWWNAVSGEAPYAVAGRDYYTAVERDAIVSVATEMVTIPARPDPSKYERFYTSFTIEPGVYLVCNLDPRPFLRINVCVYEEFRPGSHNYLELGYQVSHAIGFLRNFEPGE